MISEMEAEAAAHQEEAVAHQKKANAEKEARAEACLERMEATMCSMPLDID
jgi:hypothetical protein